MLRPPPVKLLGILCLGCQLLISGTFFACANDTEATVLHIIYVNVCTYVHRQESCQVTTECVVVGVQVPFGPLLASAHRGECTSRLASLGVLPSLPGLVVEVSESWSLSAGTSSSRPPFSSDGGGHLKLVCSHLYQMCPEASFFPKPYSVTPQLWTQQPASFSKCRLSGLTPALLSQNLCSARTPLGALCARCSMDSTVSTGHQRRRVETGGSSSLPPHSALPVRCAEPGLDRKPGPATCC